MSMNGETPLYQSQGLALGLRGVNKNTGGIEPRCQSLPIYKYLLDKPMLIASRAPVVNLDLATHHLANLAFQPVTAFRLAPMCSPTPQSVIEGVGVGKCQGKRQTNFGVLDTDRNHCAVSV